MSGKDLSGLFKETGETFKKDKPDVSLLYAKSGLYVDHLHGLLENYKRDDLRESFLNDSGKELGMVCLYKDDVEFLGWFLNDLMATWDEIAEECKGVVDFE